MSHILTLQNAFARIVFLSTQGKLDEAEPLYKEALAIDKKVFGDEHPQVALALNNLAVLLEEGFGNYEESYKLKKEALAIWKKVHGDEHPLVATGLNNLAELLSDQGKHDEAAPLYKEAIAIFKKVVVLKNYPHPPSQVRYFSFFNTLRVKFINSNFSRFRKKIHV